MSKSAKVLITRKIPINAIQQIQEVAETEIWPEQLPPPREYLEEKIRDCAGIVSLLTDSIDEKLMACAKDLRVISNFAVGVNNIDIQAATARGIAVGNTPGVLTQATADIAVSLLLAVARRLHESALDAASGNWKTWEPLGWLGQELEGKTVGIVGMGRIGFATAKRLHFGWDMPIIYHSRSTNAEAEQKLQARKVDMDTLLQTSDFISIHTDLNPQTRGMFTIKEFEKMKPSAILINTSRGPVLNQTDLAKALRLGLLFAAGLDVTDPEPLPPSHELYSLKNCLIVPHIASATFATRNEMARICAENLIAGISNKPLRFTVNPECIRKQN